MYSVKRERDALRCSGRIKSIKIGDGAFRSEKKTKIC
jgi:hypothetical protein